MFIHFITSIFFYPSDVLCYLFITFNDLHLAAISAHKQMFMSVHCWPDPMTAAWLVNLLDQSQDIQHFQGSVNTGNTRGRFQLQGFMIYILGSEWSWGGGDDFHHLQARLGHPVTMLMEGIFPIREK